MKKNNPINRMFKQLVRFVRRGRSGEVFSLAEEWAYYTENVGRFPLPDARKKFVLIKGAQSAGYFDTFNEAARAGYERFKASPFLVQPVDDRPIEIACCKRPQWVKLPA